MSKICIAIVVLSLFFGNMYSTVNYSLYVDFEKSSSMMFFILAADETSFSVYGDQFIAGYLTRQGYVSEYVPDVSVLQARLHQVYAAPSIPDVYVIMHNYYLVRSASEIGYGTIINDMSQGAMFDMRLVNTTRNFDFESAPVVAQIEFFEKNENIKDGIDELFTKILNDVFKR